MNLVSPHSLGKLAWSVVNILCKTLTIELRGSDREFYRDGGKPMIYTTWHGRMLVPLFCRKNRGVYVLVSQHRDGELVTATVLASGNKTVRGSTTRGGARALVKLIRIVKNGSKISITPDGPKGPRFHMQTGLVYVAAKSGVPVVPVSASVSRAFYFKSWDTFQFPLPFAKAVFIIGEPYNVTGGLDDANIEYHRAELEKRLIALTDEADKLVGASTEKR